MKKSLKKSLALFLATVILFAVSPIIGVDFSTPASAASVSDLTFVPINCDTEYEVSDCNQAAAGDLTIPATYAGKSVTSIGAQAFSDCSALTSVTIPVGVKSIKDAAFLNCGLLERVTVYEGVTSIGNTAFGNCTSLKRITIPLSVTSIGNFAFANCISFESIIIPNGVTSIGEYAFSNCSKLASVTIPAGVTKIGSDAFSGTKINNTAANWTNKVLYIDNCLIASQSDITTCDVMAGTRLIADNALSSRSNLKSVTVPASVTSIGNMAFDNCSRLEGISVASSNTNYSSDAGVLFSKNKKELICYPKGKAGSSYSIPSGVTSIADNAFYNCDSLMSVTIPNGVTSIGEYAFFYCESLENINIPDSVTSIGNLSFSRTAYYDNGDNWINDVLYIDNCLILGNTVITSCVIAEGTRLIADNAFSDLKNLVSISIPGSVSNIGDWVFYNCENLKNVAIPDGVKSFGDYLFYNCSKLTSVKIPDEVASIGTKAFYNCESLKSVTIPDGISSIGDYLFFNCISLESVTIPVSVTTVGYRAFQFCNILSDVYYSGSESDRTKIKIDSDNGSFINATWHCAISVRGVTVSPTSKTLAVGAMQQLTATVTPDNASNKAVTWISSDTSVATVDKNGLVTAKSAGTATITVKTNDGNKTAICAITVAIPVTGVTLDITSKTLAIGATQQITATVAPTNATNKAVSWTSTNTAIATVSSTGLVTARSSGATTIIATTEDGSKFAVCTITVTVPVTDITLDITSKTLAVGATQQLSATVTPHDATNKSVTWTSSNNSVATVNASGLVTAKAAGTATITATNADGDKTANCAVTVVINPTITIKNLNNSASINYGETLRLTAITTDMPEGAKIEWSVQGAGVALKVSEDTKTCEATSIASGTVTVTAKIVDEDGEPITDANGNEITASQQIKSNAGFFQKLISFFKNLFGVSRIIVQSFKQF